jgi:ankyrin repeat protein
MVDSKRFSDAVWSGDLESVDAVIERGADVNAVDEPHDPPLHLAIERVWVSIVRRLIDAGADINRDLRDGWTPLVHAIDIESDGAWQSHHETGHESTVLTEILLIAGAVPTARAFEIARSYDNRNALALLTKFSSKKRGGWDE